MSGQQLPRAAWCLVTSRAICHFGATLTTFGLDVWVFSSTGSYPLYAYLAVLAALPSLVFAPFAGIIADRCGKKAVLLWCDAVSALSVLLALALHHGAGLSVTMVAVTTLVLAVAAELRWSVLGVSMTLLVPAQQLVAVNALQQSLRGVNVMLGPICGAIGLQALGLDWLLALAVLCYLAGLLALLGIAFPCDGSDGAVSQRKSLLEELTLGLNWVWQHAPLRHLLLFFMLINIGVAAFAVAATPYMLSFSGTDMLGWSQGLQGAGACLCGMLLMRRGNGISSEAAVLWGALGFGTGMLLWGVVRNSAALLLVSAALGALATLIMASSAAIWQLHVPQPIQGRVFAVRTMCSLGFAPLSILATVPLAHLVCEPLLQRWPLLLAGWGSGAGGALGLLISVLGLCVLLAAAALIANGGLRLTARTPRHLMEI